MVPLQDQQSVGRRSCLPSNGNSSATAEAREIGRLALVVGARVMVVEIRPVVG